MFAEYSKTTTTFIVGIITFPYALQVQKCIYPPKTYEDGKKDGYDQAKQELRNVAKVAVSKTIGYIDADVRRIEENVAVADLYLEEKVKIAILPRWNLELLGDKFVVRRPLHAHWNNAWFMTEEDSQEIDNNIQEMLIGTKFEMDPNKTELSKRVIQDGIQHIVNEQSVKCMVHGKT